MHLVHCLTCACPCTDLPSSKPFFRKNTVFKYCYSNPYCTMFYWIYTWNQIWLILLIKRIWCDRIFNINRVKINFRCTSILMLILANKKKESRPNIIIPKGNNFNVVHRILISCPGAPFGCVCCWTVLESREHSRTRKLAVHK